mgnify:CR=1 FL=1
MYAQRTPHGHHTYHIHSRAEPSQQSIHAHALQCHPQGETLESQLSRLRTDVELHRDGGALLTVHRNARAARQTEPGGHVKRAAVARTSGRDVERRVQQHEGRQIEAAQ